jgi:CheY-like chemotaxis protein
MSHEMKTPMNVILGLNELILKDPTLTKETRSKNEKIKRSGEHLLDLINNILDINNLETGEIVCRNKDFSLPKMIDQVNAIANTLCEEKGLDFEMSVDQNLAENYIGDNVLIKEILLSIFDNAVKYTDVPGKITFTVSGDCEADVLPGIVAPSVPVQFIVSDTGIGIDKDYLPLIFEKFSQEDASATNRGGSGLGLATAKETADLLNGRILVESKKNEGSVFTLIVPLAPSSLPEPVQKDTTSEQPDTLLEEVSLEGCRILIVEDIPENAEIVADLLELEDAETEHAENGKIALDMFKESPECYYDAILMDLRMPILDGLETARKLRGLDRKDARTIPIIALTANAFESDIKQTIEAGMNAHLAKPVDADAMYDALKYYISNRPDK